jgi:hypothetical protein
VFCAQIFGRLQRGFDAMGMFVCPKAAGFALIFHITLLLFEFVIV